MSETITVTVRAAVVTFAVYGAAMLLLGFCLRWLLERRKV